MTQPSAAVASVMLYSGRPDPEWSLSKENVMRIFDLWESLAVVPDPPEHGSQLGYRGVRVIIADGTEFTAFGGTVLRRIHAQPECRSDPTGGVERLVIASAPPGLLPDRLDRFVIGPS